MKNEYKYHYNYIITCLVNNKQYIGQHSSNNLDNSYYGSSKLLKQDIEQFITPLVKEYIESTQLDNYRMEDILRNILRGRLVEIFFSNEIGYYHKIIREYLISESYKLTFFDNWSNNIYFAETYTIDIVEKRKKKIEKLKNNITQKNNPTIL